MSKDRDYDDLPKWTDLKIRKQKKDWEFVSNLGGNLGVCSENQMYKETGREWSTVKFLSKWYMVPILLQHAFDSTLWDLSLIMSSFSVL